MLQVAFVNENTLGHRSYLLPFVQTLRAKPDHGIVPHWIDATPLPPDLKRYGEFSVKLLRRWGLDWGPTRWRSAASRHVQRQLQALYCETRLDAVVINTQSVALELMHWWDHPPLFVCLDATFAQLARSPWFANGRIGRLAAPITLAGLRRRERELFREVTMFLPWSEAAADSLRMEYRIPAKRIQTLPPSVSLGSKEAWRAGHSRKSILFVGGDFKRKGGPLLVEAFLQYLRGDFELDIVTQSPIESAPDIRVHRGISAGSPAWHALWQEADVFVFPSSLETFGIVLLEALAFRVPAVSSPCGAAREILDNGAAGLLLDEMTPVAVAEAVRQVFTDEEATAHRVDRGANRVAHRYCLEQNTARLAESLRSVLDQKTACVS